MGQEASITSTLNNQPLKEEINKNRFEFVNIIGRGGFGKVWRVIEKKSKTQYALKEMIKAKIIDKKSWKSIKYERDLLSHLHHSFIVNMHYAFQDYETLYLVLDLLNGGDLRYHISRQRRFTEEQTTLEYIHSNCIIHRDIKPENLVLNNKGYIRITDFGIAKQYSINNANETSGTPGYMSPEVLKAQNHSYAADYYAIGVIGYEFMLGKRPYQGRTRQEIKDQITTRQACIKESEMPYGWHIESADFFNKLLLRKQEMRLGYLGINELKEHPWFKSFPWNLILKERIVAPFIPDNKDNFDKKYCETLDKQGMETKARYEKYKKSQNYNNLFNNYTYAIEPKPNTKPIPNDSNDNSHYQNIQESSKPKRCQSSIDLPNDKQQSLFGNNMRFSHAKFNLINLNLDVKSNIKHQPLVCNENSKDNSQTKIPIPITHNKKYIRSMSNMCISPFMMHNKSSSITIDNQDSLSSIHHNKNIQQEKEDETSSRKNNSNMPICNGIRQFNNDKPFNNLPMSNTCNGGLTNIICNNSQCNNKKDNTKQIYQVQNYNHKEKLNGTFLPIKNIRTNSGTLNSTRASISMSAKIIYNAKNK